MANPSPLLKAIIRKAQTAGLSASAFIKQRQAAGLGYRRSEMLSDWRSVGNIEAKKGRMKYVRKDYKPTGVIIAQTTWEFSKEYMHKVKVWTQTRPGEPLKDRWVNIMSDKPMTPGEIEQEILGKLPEYADSLPGTIKQIVPETVIRGSVK